MRQQGPVRLNHAKSFKSGNARGANAMSVIGNAADWIISAISGSSMTAVMSLAVALFGMSLLAGNFSLRRGFQLALGCFVLIGSAEIAAALTGAIARADNATDLAAPGPLEIVNSPPPVPDREPLPSSGDPFDPYAGSKPVQ